MSEALNIIPLHTITSPELADINYAKNLEAVFANINENFTRLANHDFIKGESGASVEIKEVQLITDDGEWTVYGKRLKECIESLSTNMAEYEDIKYTIDDEEYTLNIFDYLLKYPENSKLQMIFNKANDENLPVAAASLYYVFLDGRYANSVIGKIDSGLYTNTKDMSCIVVYDATQDGFVALQNAFPTIYYEKGIGLCWKVNGNPTGIPVQGIPGKDGLNATLQIVKCESVDNTNNNIIRGEVTHVYNMHDGYVGIEMDDIDAVRAQYDNQAALILVTEVDKGFYFGHLRVDGDKLYAYCDQDSAINYGIETEAVLNAMKKINLLNNGNDASSGAKGLFIPMQTEKDGVQPVHLLSATSITNTEGQNSDVKADFVFTPIKNINKLNITENNALQVDKYLYLRIAKNARSAIFVKSDSTGEDININENLCKTYNYVIKYKLTNVVKDVKDTWFNVLTSNSNGITGSRTFGKVKFKKDGVSTVVSLNDTNTVYYGNDGKLTTEHVKTIPTKFAERLNNTGVTKNDIGIYRWEICNDVNDFDVDDLKAVNTSKYNFANAFGVVYTTTINPSDTADFMWFNAQHLATTNDTGVEDDNNVDGQILSGDYSEKYVVLGWSSGNNDNVLEFVKFVPIYNNDFGVDEDTALNLNYNVNVTGDENNPNRSITVHGSVNCDDLSVYRLTATGEIKNIFTREDIIGEGGIKLCKGYNNDDYIVTIDKNGVIKTDTIVDSKYVMAENINASKVVTTQQLNTNDLRINDNQNKRRLFAGNSNTDDYDFTIELMDAENIDMNRKINTKDLGNNIAQPVVSSDIPVIQHNNSNIIVSNETKGSEQLCYYGVASTTKKVGTTPSFDGGSGVSGSATNKYVEKPDFDHVKNFNIHRLSIDAKAGQQVKLNIVSNNHLQGRKFDTNNRIVFKEQGYVRSLDANALGLSDARCMETFTIQRNMNDENTRNVEAAFDRSQPIRISFDTKCTYLTHIGVKGENSNGRWPVMLSKSYMKLRLYYKINGETTYTPIAEQSYTLDFTTSSTKDDNGYEWRGYEQNTGADLSGRGDTEWRFYPYAFRPKEFVINSRGFWGTTNLAEAYKKIADAYDNCTAIDFYVYPEFYLAASGQNESWIKGGDPKKVVCGLSAYTFIPVNAISGVTAGATSIKNLKNISNSIVTTYAKAWQPSVQNGMGTISFVTREFPKGSSSSKVTTLCNDGIVIRSGTNVFGIGCGAQVYDHKTNGYNVISTSNPTWNPNTGMNASYLQNEPVLFYHTANGDYYDSKKEPKTGGKDLKGYALRTHAIPLKDIFEVIKWMRSSSTSTYGV